VILNHSDKSIHVLDHFEHVLWLDDEHRFLVLVGGAGSGKAVPLDTKVITPKGYVRMEDIKVGQTICSTKGSLEKVIWKSDVQHVDLYKLTFADGREVTACKDHLWKIDSENKSSINTTLQLKDKFDAGTILSIPLPEPAVFEDSCPNEPDLYSIGEDFGTDHPPSIPQEFKFTTAKKRSRLLLGILNSGGVSKKDGDTILISSQREFVEDLQWLVRSLGGTASVSDCGGYIISIGKPPSLKITNIEYIGKGDAQCIAVDDDESLYMIDDFVVTHNSHAICQRISYLFLTQEDISIAVVRRTMPALKRSVYKGNPSIMKTLMEFGAPAYDWLNSTDFKLTNPHNGSTIQFIGLDDPEKVKSDNYNYIWVEEATEINANIWMQLNARLRRPQPHRINQMFLSYNPVSHSNWAVQTFSASGDSEIKKYSNVHFSTFIDNHYVSLSDVLTWFLNAKRDENWYRTYILGIPSVPQGQIYPNISFSPSKMWPKEVWNTKPYYGIDWGFNHPMCLVELRDYKDKTYGRTLFHEREKTTSDLIRFMNEHKLPKSAHYYCDSAERDRIAELGRAGYSVFKAKKNVLAGIAHVRSLKITYDNSGKLGARSADELIEYCWEPDPDNPGEFFDKPLELKDETPDCVRYATYTHHMYGGEVQYAQLDLSDFGKRLNLINGDETEGDDIDRFSW
jgi:phage terminase large subunit